MKRVSQKITTGILVVSLLCSLGADVKTANAAKTAKISQKKLTLEVGQKKKLKVKFAKKKVKWTSNKKKIATVSQKGIVKAKKEGKAVITAKVGKKKLQCKVTVVKATVPESTEVPSSTTPTPEVQNGQATTSPNVEPQPTASTDVTNTSQPENTPSGSDSEENTPSTTSPAEPTPTPVIRTGDLTASKGSGTYEEEFTLTMKSALGNTIYYTTDGSDPRTSSTRVEYKDGIAITSRENDANVLSAISPDLFDTMNKYVDGNTVKSYCIAPPDDAVDKCTVVRGVSCGSDGIFSDVVTNTYFIGKMSEHINNISTSVEAMGQNLAVISITMDQSDLFDYEKGIYVKGKTFDDSVNAYIQEHGSLNSVNVEGDLTGNYKQKGREWERECHMEYFETDGTNTTCELQQDCGIRIQGNYSRENVQKSFRLYAREEYGVKNFKYPFFGEELQDADGEAMSKFKTLVLRNGGNDAFNYKYKDIFTQSFVHDRDYMTLHGRPCVVYLDGEYWGYYVLQDDLSDNFLQNKYGVEKDNVVVYKGTDEKKYADYKYKLDEGEFPEGVTEEDYYLKDTLDYLDGSKDFSDDAVYQEFCNTYVDEQSALDYFATMIYLNNGYDWPGKNWSIWRTTVVDENNEYADNRWRFCLFDLDLTTVPTWSQNAGNEWQQNNISKLADKSDDNVMKKIFGNMMDNASFKTKLATAIQEIGSVNYAYDKVSAQATVYKNAYSALSDQFQYRFNSNKEIHSIGEQNHNANISFFSNRGNYISSLVYYLTGEEAEPEPEPEKPEAVDNVLVWEGNWTKGGVSNVTTSETLGLTTVRDDSSYIQISVDDWSVYTNPVIRLTVADGYTSNCRFHIWDYNKSIVDKYYYQETEPWIGVEIPLSSLSGNTFYINVTDCFLTKFEIYDKSNES